MDAQTVVSFVRFMNSNPKLKHNKKAFKKEIDKAGDEMFRIRKKKVFDQIKEQKSKLMDCFDIYEKFLEENKEDLFSSDISPDEMVERLMKVFGIEVKEDNEETEVKKEDG